MVATIEIAGRRVGPGYPCFIIAEAGVNHNGDVTRAAALVDAAVEAQADAVKFQTFHAEEVATPLAPKAGYQRLTTDAAESQLEMIRRLELPPEAFRALQACCARQKILFLSTPFDHESVDLLDELSVPAFKVASGEITNWPLLEHIASKGKPVILSTGMSTLGEVEAAVRVIRGTGNDQLALLHCVSNYPAEAADVNLRAMQTMATTFGVPVGYSDHTLGSEVALAAVALGACIIEKHYTLDRTLPGPDHRASVEPAELVAFVRGIRRVEVALGHGRKEPAARELETAAAARRSVVAARDITSGTTLTETLMHIRRPGTGLPPALRAQLIGRRTKVEIPAGTPLTWEMVV